MYAISNQTVLRCERCNKPFDKYATLKRHGYYCRSRKAGKIVRSRSCTACVIAKARCDNKFPSCTRCISKRIDCQFSARTTTRTGGDSLSASPDAQDDSRSAPPSRTFSNHDDPATTPFMAALSELEAVVNADSALLQWQDPCVDLFDLSAYNHSNESFEDSLLEWSSSTSPEFFTRGIDSIYPTPATLPSPAAQIPLQPTQRTRSLIKRNRTVPASRRVGDLILHILKSYLYSIQRDDTLPPFIHATLVSPNAGNTDMEALIDCISLVRMLGNEARANRKLFWKNVRAECERINAEYHVLNKWQLLAAMQALSIYILIRLDEGETDYNNFDSLLITTVAVVSQQLPLVEASQAGDHAVQNHGLEAEWREWIFEESVRRMCVVYQVVNMLFFFEPAKLCDHPTTFILAPLPAGKRLWEASDALMWKIECGKIPGGEADFGLAANGDLVRINAGRASCRDETLVTGGGGNGDETSSTSKSANWEEWCAGMDSFGGLIMLAASLTG